MFVGRCGTTSVASLPILPAVAHPAEHRHGTAVPAGRSRTAAPEYDIAVEHGALIDYTYGTVVDDDEKQCASGTGWRTAVGRKREPLPRTRQVHVSISGTAGPVGTIVRVRRVD